MPAAAVHLLVLIHGMWGNPGHLSELNRIICETYSADDTTLDVLLAETNRGDSTYDGMDWGGERVAQEIYDRVQQHENDGKTVTKFSVTGYSLGGLVARYVIGILHQRKFFDCVKPVNFNTIATPHLGLPRYPTMASSFFSAIGQRLLSRTGEQFYCVDTWSNTGKPLLEVMSDPDRIFYQALASFLHVRIYANAINDSTVPYVTSAIEVEDPFAEVETNGLEVEYNAEYHPLIQGHSLPPTPPPAVKQPFFLSPSWFRKKRRPFFPPAFQLPFPLNLVLYILLPVIIPIGASYLVVNFAVASRSSRARIRDLEADKFRDSRLVYALRELEREVQDVQNVVADLVDDHHPELSPSPSPSSSSLSDSATGSGVKPLKGQPIITPLQRSMAALLNGLPGIKKEVAYMPHVRNSHAIIVCRDVKRYELHRMGEGVLRHWADSFIL